MNSSIIITIISCSIIVVVFILYLKQIWRIKNGCILTLKQALDSDTPLKSIMNTCLSDDATAYEKTINIEFENEKKSSIPSDEYFSEFSICKSFNVNTKNIDAGSGTLVGLGLLGTFLGLTFGIYGFDSSTTDNIQTSIQSLLGGMGTAFMTSLFGMALSLVYTYFDKKYKNQLSRTIYDFTHRLDDQYYISDIELALHNQRKSTEKLIKDITAELHSVADGLYTRIKPLMEYKNSEGTEVPVANAIREILSNNQEQTRALKSFSTDLAIELSNGFDEMLSRQLQQRLIPLMESVDKTTQSVVEHIDQMSIAVSNPATDMIERVVSDLKSSIVGVMEEFRETISRNTTSELENLALSLGSATKAIGEFPKNMANISEVLQLTITEVRNSISEISNSSATANSSAMKQMQDQIVFATSSISTAITEVKEVMTSLTEASKSSSNDLIDKMSKSSDDMGSFMRSTMEQIAESLQSSIQTISENLETKQTKMLSMQDSSLANVTEVISNLTESSRMTTENVISKINGSANDMSDSLKATMDSIGEAMKGVMKKTTDDVAEKYQDLLQLQDTTTAQTEKLLSLFNHSIERLNNTNSAMTGTMDMFQQAQTNITGTTASLHSISTDMKTATEVFRSAQKEYNSTLERLEDSTMRKMDTYMKLMENAGNTTNEYSEKFEVIRKGLSEIFAQIQNGLNNYSTTVRTSIQQYLDVYSRNLTETTGSLQAAIQAQNEVVEMMVSSLDKKRR